MEDKKELKVVVQLINPVLVEVGDGKTELWPRLIFSNTTKYYEGSKMVKITTKGNKEWMFPYTNIKSIEYKEEDVKQARQY